MHFIVYHIMNYFYYLALTLIVTYNRSHNTGNNDVNNSAISRGHVSANQINKRHVSRTIEERKSFN